MVNTSGFWHFKLFLHLKLTLYSFFKVFFEIKLHLQICTELKLLWRFAKSRSWGTFKRYASKLFLSYYICIFKLETAKVLPWRLFEYCLLLLITRFTPFTTIIILKIYRKFLQKIECLCNLCLSKLNILILIYRKRGWDEQSRLCYHRSLWKAIWKHEPIDWGNRFVNQTYATLVVAYFYFA